MPMQPSPKQLQRLVLGGSGALSIVESAGVMSVQDDYKNVQDDLIVVNRAQFRACIAQYGFSVVARWEGAWERTQRPGPDAASQAAHSLVELIDWSLREAAPDDEVLSWHRAESRPAAELHVGKPTRKLRLQFLVRDRKSDAEGAEILITSLLAMVQLLQKKKHAQGDNERVAIRRLIPGIESMLYFVLAYR
jgi:hypothetical protein